ncbi:MAG: putative glycosyltransferase EpsJ [Syntrophorhabdus sp. PtaU1.Bin050]|jgi:rhamnosyltransferase|nr:MAG: putative glycosyltransferase EpsJ [Syntrophorhabdus sp. PtaU1.Bin050]
MISVIVPTLNAEKFMEPLCKSLIKQSLSCEVVVVDSSSSDGTAETARNCGAKVVEIRRKDFSHGGTRNIGASKATGDILVFLTQDAVPVDDRLLEKLTQPLGDGTCAASYGKQIPSEMAIPPERFARLFNYPDAPVIKDKSRIPELGIKTFFFSNVCSTIRRDIFEELGGFPDNVIMDEDLLFAARLVMKGYKIAYVPEAQVFHTHNYTLSEQFHRYFDIGVFFSDNSWLLAYAGMNSEGGRFVRNQLSYLVTTGAYVWIPYVFGEIFAKYGAYKLGLHYRMLPKAARKWLSMHKAHWDKPSTVAADNHDPALR